MTKCRWSNEAGEYLADGEPCKTDDYGDPTRHCTARRTCSVHIGEDELTCPRCIARARGNLRKLTPLAALVLPVAVARLLGDDDVELVDHPRRLGQGSLKGGATWPAHERPVRWSVAGTHPARLLAHAASPSSLTSKTVACCFPSATRSAARLNAADSVAYSSHGCPDAT